MSDLIRRLLGLDSFSWGDANVSFGFERAFPAWLWVGLIVAAGVYAAWSYRRIIGPRWARIGLATLRWMVVVLLMALVSGPRLVEQSESVEKDWVVVMLDRSASMTIRDVEQGAAQRESREEQLRAALGATRSMWEELAKDRTLVWLGFDSGAYDLPTGDSGTVRAMTDPEGRTTSISGALDQALTRSAARPVSAFVVISDGRATHEPPRALVQRLQAARIPVHTVALGSEQTIGDVGLVSIEAPPLAFVGDITPVIANVERLGATGAPSATIRLIERATGLTLDERRVTFAEGETRARAALSVRADAAKVAEWDVVVVPDAPDLIDQNNTRQVSVEMVDRPLRVLYVDGYPRWEQRYVKNLLIREGSIKSSNLLLAPDRRYTQEGDVIVAALPDSPEGWAEYDVVILGDVRPDVFTIEQLTQLREHVAIRGAGLIFIAGEGAMPGDWWNTPLADLLPMSAQAIAAGAGEREGVIVRPTPVADRLGVLRLGASADDPWPAALTDPSMGWSLLRWVQRIDPAQLKPTAQILAEGTLAGGDPVGPVVLAMRYGAGRSLYVATDETWRWRYGQGEVLPERFWLQMVRMLGRGSLSRAGRAAILEVTPSRATTSAPVRISVELVDQSIIDMGLPSVAVRIGRQGDEAETELTLKPESLRTGASSGGGSHIYSTTWIPPEPGEWVVRVTESDLALSELHETVEVFFPDDELRTPETDHPLLARLSDETGGVAFTPASLSGLPENLRSRERVTLRERYETLWDSPLALILLISLLTVEWVGRRVIRLL